MLEEQHRYILIEGYHRFKETNDREHIDEAIRLVKLLAPQHFFRDHKDPALLQRVFFHQPYSSHWSGTAIVLEKAC